MDINKSSITTGADGCRYKIEVYIKDHDDAAMYPEGVKAVFKMIRLDVNEDNESELLVLIDNHQPLGFHSHAKLPENHDYRQRLYTSDWREAWSMFQEKYREILK